MTSPAFAVTCWNCLAEFDDAAAVWCSDNPKTPTKLCPFCLLCFCDATEAAYILRGETAYELEGLAIGAGMVPLRHRGIDLMRRRETSFDEFAKLRL